MLALTGFLSNCDRSPLGVVRIIFTRSAFVNSITFDTLDRITNVTMEEGKGWYELETANGEAYFQQRQNRQGAWPVTEQEITFTNGAISSAFLRAIRRLGDASLLHAIVVLEDDSQHYLGINVWPERGYHWETTNLAYTSGSTDAGDPQTGGEVAGTLSARGRNYAPVMIQNLEDFIIEQGTNDIEPDLSAPFPIDFYPADNAVGVSLTPGFLQIVFNEPVKWDGVSTVTITLNRTGVGVVKTWTLGTSPGLYFDQPSNSFFISQGLPTLLNSTGYHVEISSGIEDLSGNGWAGISTSSAWNFTTLAPPDTTELTVVSFTPSDDSTSVDPSSTTELEIQFDNDCEAGAGNILLFQGDAGSPVLIGVYDVLGSSVAFAGDTCTITIGSILQSNQDYFIRTTPGAIQSADSGIAWTGVNDATTWNFTTIDLGPPAYATFAPTVASDGFDYGAGEISFTATEDLQKGSGTIYIKDWDDDSTLISLSVGDAAVTISGNEVTIDISGFDILPPYKRVYIEQAAGVFQDLSANDLPSLTKAGADLWNFTTALPPLAMTIAPVTGAGAQTIAGEFTGHASGGVVVIEWDPGDYSRYEVATGLNTLTNTWGAETFSNVNIYFIGSDSAGAGVYEVHTAYFESEAFIQGITFPGGGTIGSFYMIDAANIEYLTNLDATDFPDLLQLDNLGAFTGEELDFVTNGGGVGTYVIAQNIDDLTLTLASVSGFPTLSLTISTCTNLNFSLGSLIFNPATPVSVYFDNNEDFEDGVVANKFVAELFQRLDSNGAGTYGGYLDLTAMQIDYTTGTAAADAWRSMWQIFNLPASPTSWAFTFDPTSGPLSVVETNDTSIVHTIESVGLPIGVMIGNTESGIFSIHDYTTSGTARTTQTQTGMTSGAKHCWMAWYFADGQDISGFTEIPYDTDTTKDFAIYTSIGTAGSGQRRIMDLGDGSVLQTDDGNDSFANKARTVTPTGSVFSCRSILELSAATTFYFQDTVGAVTGDLDLSPAGTLIVSFRIENSSITSLNLTKAQLDGLTQIRLNYVGVGFSEEWDLSDNTTLNYVQITNVTGLNLIVGTTSGQYAPIGQLNLSNSTFVNGIDLTGFDSASILHLSNCQADSGKHTIPSAMPDVAIITCPGTVDINDFALELDNFPNLATADLRGGVVSSFSLSTPPHGKMFNLLLSPVAGGWSQSNTLDFSGESQWRNLQMSGSGSIGPMILPGVGNGGAFDDLLINNLMDSADVDDLIDDAYDIRTEGAATGKILQVIPRTGSVSSTQVDKILGTGAYAGDGLVDNGFSVTYV